MKPEGNKGETMKPEIIGCIVLQGGQPCTLYNAADTRRGGVLLPCADTAPVVFFAVPRDAARAIARTGRVAGLLKGSLVDDWVRLSPLHSGRAYEIVPVMRSHVSVKKEV
jgi:hypothetical protein